MSSYGDFNQLLETLLTQLQTFMDLFMYGVQDFSSIYCFLNHFSPIWGSPMTWEIYSSEMESIRFPTWALLPSNVLANYLVTSRL